MSTLDFSTRNPGNFPEEQSLRLMIVDDHELLRHGLHELINTLKGFTVVAEANSCRDALAQFQRTTIDLIFMDLSLPDGNGMELIHQFRQRSTPPDIIVLSATLNDDLLLETMLAGASGYLTKDVPATEIVRLLQGFRQGEMVMTPSVASRLINLLVQKCLDLTVEDETTVSKITPNHHSHDPHPMDSLPDIGTSPLQHLTRQEDKIFQLMRLGQSNKQIAAQLSISHFTVGKHVQNILRKLGVINRTQAALYTASEGAKNTFHASKHSKYIK
jgi:two-component system, NarL family, response regulator DevR